MQLTMSVYMREMLVSDADGNQGNLIPFCGSEDKASHRSNRVSELGGCASFFSFLFFPPPSAMFINTAAMSRNRAWADSAAAATATVTTSFTVVATIAAVTSAATAATIITAGW